MIFDHQKLVQIREERGLNRQGLADATGGKISRQAVYLWETGAQVPNARSLGVLCEALGVGVEYFFVSNYYHSNNEAV